LRETIAEIADKLGPEGFIRIHRSVLVNGAHVESVQPGAGSEYILRTKTGKEFHVTRTYRSNLRSLAQLWSGSEAFFVE
jgi:two-component system LytT family response regulator